MIKTNTNREQRKILELAQQYKSKGYRVSTLPQGNSVPAFLRQLQFTPDLIAQIDDGDSLVVEVSSRESSERLRALAPIVDAIDKKRNWKFVLVMTNPRPGKSKRIVPVSSIDELQESLVSLRRQFSGGSHSEFSAPVLLAGWAVLEGSLRRSLSDKYHVKSVPQTPRSVIRDAITYGILTSSDAKFLEGVSAIRNAVAHGDMNAKIPKNTIPRLLKVAQAMIDDFKAPDENA